uniref:Uncharacterized protein n=1 Tax=Arundo donax TaxID=35708 RepID=A0A0A8ZZT5_ARUDO
MIVTYICVEVEVKLIFNIMALSYDFQLGSLSPDNLRLLVNFQQDIIPWFVRSIITIHSGSRPVLFWSLCHLCHLFQPFDTVGSIMYFAWF